MLAPNKEAKIGACLLHRMETVTGFLRQLAIIFFPLRLTEWCCVKEKKKERKKERKKEKLKVFTPLWEGGSGS
ncbi:MAG: hypothetical protein VXZ18_19250, partial [Pseudomonadota bacterium]|nr:hypothetical protein [Pseudomonadota bacterium]